MVMCYNLSLNTFSVLIFVLFVADSHFDRMFEMVLIFTECLKWSLFSLFVFDHFLSRRLNQ